ncbi:two-component sensor histidine kinase [Flexivirga endophytica]|uniref:histidine kinase n=1 Tax=Flexivirga endophytica TaxID=1849103 RepID=A0A916T2V3_9MICO|nr:HAMP domain-containing sensor histidine kinase [Flexivirga endophytica]GGB25670.1 two-component sensor histidine kinase [Flexivirga endophytica]GHB54263.1 two-component sensor histidine kinase [Flexivirga endophytica]
MTTTASSWQPSRWTLRTKLVAWMLLLFVIVTLAVGSLAVWRLNQTLTSSIDTQLQNARAVIQGSNPDQGGGQDIGLGGGNSLQMDVDANGDVLYHRDYQTQEPVENATVNSLGGSTQLTKAQQRKLLSAGLGSTPKAVDLGRLGTYQLIAVRHAQSVRSLSDNTVHREDVTTVIGLPLDDNTDTVRKTALSIGLFSGAGVILIAVAATVVIQRNLEPLRRVAATAARVSKLPLSSGEVVMPERVEPRDTDERTEVGQVGASLNDMLDHIYNALTARQASEMQVRQFVADASHELRTPLASIRGYAELSRRETQPVPQGVTHALGRIESEAGRMTTLVEDLLLLARLDSGRPLDFAPVELPIVAIETISDARAAGPDHVWGLDLPEEGIEIEADEARIRQILINLLGNARKHTPAGTQVVVSVHAQGDGVLIQVRDNGPGIAPELVPRIFERFIRGDVARTRTEGSTGLGLSIVSAVVSAHHGRVDVSSRPGETVFSIWLPRRQPVPGPKVPNPAAPHDPRVPV